MAGAEEVLTEGVEDHVAPKDIVATSVVVEALHVLFQPVLDHTCMPTGRASPAALRALSTASVVASAEAPLPQEPSSFWLSTIQGTARSTATGTTG